MSSIHELLNQIWSLFRQSGVADNLSIVEYIASLLVQDNSQSAISDNMQSRILSLPNIEGIRRKIQEAVEKAGGAATLFDQYLLFHLPSMLPGGRYPTPRHLVESILRLAQVEPTHRLADFACGSGGFLARREKNEDTETALTTGIEISPEWARLAWTNMSLHKLTSPRIEVGNALQVCAPYEALANETFDRIVMNPPFGEKVDMMLAEQALGQKVGSRSETALTALALSKLTPGGRAAILVPSGLLFANSVGERKLRQWLVDAYCLEAVISLPKDAFQPFSSLQTHLFLLDKIPPTEQYQTWLIQTEYDGYPSGRSRDLTLPPTGPSDLPFVEGIVAVRSEDFDITVPQTKGPLVGIKKIVSQDKTFLGVVIESIGSSSLSDASLSPAIDGASSFILLDSISSDGERHVCVQIPLDTGKAKVIQDREAFLRDLYKLRKNDPIPETSLSRGEAASQAIAISVDGRLLGVTVSSEELCQHAYDLRPDQYVQTREESRTVESPALLLGAIRHNQSQLLQRIDSLLGRLELTSIAGQQLPSARLQEDGKRVEPFGVLSQEQRAVWKQVRKKIKKLQHDGGSREIATLFTPADVEADGALEVSEGTRSTLDLLERMGLIVPVTVADPSSRESVAFYRLVTERDVWRFDLELPESEGESN